MSVNSNLNKGTHMSYDPDTYYPLQDNSPKPWLDTRG